MTVGEELSTEKGPAKPRRAKTRNRSRVTNGQRLFIALRDGNAPNVRRLSDLIAMHVSDLGGLANCSESEKAMVRCAAQMRLQLELLEQKWQKNGGEASEKSLIVYQRVTGSLRRVLKGLGLGRRAREITNTPTLDEYINAKATEDIPEEAE